MDVIQMLTEKVQKIDARIVLSEGTDLRVLKAARIVEKQNIAKVVLLGDIEEIQKKHHPLA